MQRKIFNENFPVIVCNPEKASAENFSKECPKNAHCIEMGNQTKDQNNKTDGYCGCNPGMKLNPKFDSSNKSSVYCVESGDSTTTTTTTAAPTTKKVRKMFEKLERKLIFILTKTPVSSSTSKPSTAAPKTEPTTEENKKSSDVDVKPAPEPQKGLLAAIIVPVMVVLALIGGALIVRKFGLVERTQQYVRSRRGQQHHVRILKNLFKKII